MSNRSSTVAVALAAFLIGIGVYALTLGSSSSAQDSAATGGDTADKGPAESAGAATISDLVDLAFAEGVESRVVRIQWISARDWPVPVMHPGYWAPEFPEADLPLADLPEEFYLRVYTGSGSSEKRELKFGDKTYTTFDSSAIPHGYESKWAKITNLRGQREVLKKELICIESDAAIISVGQPDFPLPEDTQMRLKLAPALSEAPPYRGEGRRSTWRTFGGTNLSLRPAYPATVVTPPGEYWLLAEPSEFSEVASQRVTIREGHNKVQLRLKNPDELKVASVTCAIDPGISEEPKDLKFQAAYALIVDQDDPSRTKWATLDLKWYRRGDGRYRLAIPEKIRRPDSSLFVRAYCDEGSSRRFYISLDEEEPAIPHLRLYKYVSLGVELRGARPELASQLYSVRIHSRVESTELGEHVLERHVHPVVSSTKEMRASYQVIFAIDKLLPGKYRIMVDRLRAKGLRLAEAEIEVTPEKRMHVVELPALHQLTFTGLSWEKFGAVWYIPKLYHVESEGSHREIVDCGLSESGEAAFPELPAGRYMVEYYDKSSREAQRYEFELNRDTSINLSALQKGD